MYCRPNFKTKKALRQALDQPDSDVRVFQPGPFGPDLDFSGDTSLEGPHFPLPHTWYARVRVRDGKVTKLLG